MRTNMNQARELFPLIVVDIALFSVHPEGLRVLLVKRAQEPELRKWALPGGILKPDIDTCLEDAALRVLRSKVAIDIPHLEQVCAVSGPDRDPRGWSVAHLYYALLPKDQVNALVRNKVEAVEWADPANPRHKMAFDHSEQLALALSALRSKVLRHALPLHLMPARFTLTSLQKTCEAIQGYPLDKSVFRRRIKGSADLIELEEYERGQQRPAQLFEARPGFRFEALK